MKYLQDLKNKLKSDLQQEELIKLDKTINKEKIEYIHALISLIDVMLKDEEKWLK